MKQFHIISSLNQGGMERIVLDIAETQDNVVIFTIFSSHHKHNIANIRPGNVIIDLSQSENKVKDIKDNLGNHHVVYTHLLKDEMIKEIWNAQIQTIPVIHNISMGRKQDINLYNNDMVPFVVACGNIVKQDIVKHGLSKKVSVIRHVPNMKGVKFKTERNKDALNILMVGRIVTQKRYTQAIKVLAEIKQMGIKCSLTIIGPVNQKESQLCLDAIKIQCKRHKLTYDMQWVHPDNITHDIVIAGGISDARKLMHYYDLFLNTSLWEGVSISTLEAILCGLPCVVSNVGGQCEIIDDCYDENKTAKEIADLVLRKWNTYSFTSVQKQRNMHYISTLAWEYILQAYLMETENNISFITGNLNLGGAQRSLSNLSHELYLNNVSHKVLVAGNATMRSYAQDDVYIFLKDQYPEMSMTTRIKSIVNNIFKQKSCSICFWNMDPFTKMLITTFFEMSDVQIVDVSPGPMMFKELDKSKDDGIHFLGLSEERYFQGVDNIVSKYNGGFPENLVGDKKKVIPNGVYSYPRVEEIDANINVLIAGRITRSKYPEVISPLAKRLKSINGRITVYGDLVPNANEGAIKDLCGDEDNVEFHPAIPDVQSVMGRYTCLVMISDDQGCPNTSLEAMAQGVPVVANYSGGTSEQIIHGFNGCLVNVDRNGHISNEINKDNAEKIFKAILNVIKNREYYSHNCLNTIHTKFSMKLMASNYTSLLSKNTV